MPQPTCAAHPTAPAVFRCDGCGKPLCDDCITEGHRLLFCKLCGERALPIATGAPATSTERRRRAVVDRPYSPGAALLYPFRGLGKYLFFGYFALTFVFSLPILGCFLWPLSLGLVLFTPSLLFAIVRSTVAGDNELPDWPDISEFGTRVGELLTFYFLAVLSFLPAGVLVGMAGCTWRDVLGVTEGGAERCLPMLFLGCAIGFLILIPSFGAVGTYESFWLSFRFDLHLRALFAGGSATLACAGGLLGLIVATRLIENALLGIPYVGVAAGVALDTYTLLLAPHLVGLLFRNRSEKMDRIYLG